MHRLARAAAAVCLPPHRIVSLAAGVSLLLATAGDVLAQPYSLGPLHGAISVLPDAVVDLATAEGLALVQGQWRHADADIVAVEHRSAGADLRASGAPRRTHDITPRAAGAGFDDSGWPVIEPATLEKRRGNGRLSFGWYRLFMELPERIGAHDIAGSTIVLEIVADDYAEISVDGRAGAALGQIGGAAIGGFNAPSRVVLTRDARAGDAFTIAVLAANGPLSNPPANFVWLRSATLDVYGAGKARIGEPVETTITRNHAALDAIVAPDARIEKLAGGFQFAEGPVWVDGDGNGDNGHLLFSDPNANRIYRWSVDGDLSVFRSKSGYSGADAGRYRQPGSNGLALDDEGRVTICEHGNRRVSRVEKNGTITILADRYQGRRLNSPNDLVYRSDGTLCFTDPPFGLPGYHDDPMRELAITGVFCLRNGTLELVDDTLAGPNGINLSPDERYLYVANWDASAKTVTRYERTADGGYGNGERFFDMTSAGGETALDGIEVDEAGNLYVSGPGGTWILSPQGRHLGTISGPEGAANFAFGDADRRTLYMAAHTGLYRIRLKVAGRAR
ncbi:MAG TPA: SMP-30/gluconolactonase/LRE family protein [Candidatus Binatia bacterium]|nr:SMP-30/gluconolactonase/LRE family protein [Candidatus Binatia bacterium]